MPDNLENSWGWYGEGTTRKVKCLLCEASFAKKGTRMLSHLRYEGPYGFRDKGVSLCRKTTPEIRRLFRECGGTFPLYPERVEVPLTDSSGTPRVGGLHALQQGTPESLHPGSSAGSVQVETGTRQSMGEVFYEANISFVVLKNKAFKRSSEEDSRISRGNISTSFLP
jgi:hypothetical protein